MTTFEKLPHNESDPAIKCPKDEIHMERYRVGTGEHAIEIDRCPRCAGIYLDQGELSRLMARKMDTNDLLKRLDKEDAVTGYATGNPVEMKCPRDDAAMATHRAHDQKHLEYEVCTSCGGVFFDAGELHDLSQVTLMDRVKGFFKD